MEITDAMFIRSRARNLLVSCWRRRFELWRGKVEKLDDFLLFAPNKIATDILGLTVVEVREIPSAGVFSGKPSQVVVVGEMNRQEKRIVYAPKYGFVQGRFTLAHEIAHYVLHPGMVLHRELPLTHEKNRSLLSSEEREANLFGAELLMPGRSVQEQFLNRFAGIVDGREKNESVFYWMSQQEPNLNKDEFFAPDPKYRAKHIAKTRYCYGRPVISLCDFYRVSVSAMAIQLLDLGLVR
jgi:hypothetical protein